VEVRVEGWGVGWAHEVLPIGGDGAKAPATLTCAVAALTGDPKVHRPSGPIFLIYRGRGKAGTESVELSFSPDGKTFARASVDEFGRPIALPGDAQQVRLTVAPGAALSGLCAIATEKPR
jgi:hypothetical protein